MFRRNKLSSDSKLPERAWVFIGRMLDITVYRYVFVAADGSNEIRKYFSQSVGEITLLSRLNKRV